MLSVIYRMSVCYDQTFHSLTENIFEFNRIVPVRSYDILENASGTYRRKLACIAYHDKTCSRSYGAQKRLHKINIYHRRFIHKYNVLIKRSVLAAMKFGLIIGAALCFK